MLSITFLVTLDIRLLLMRSYNLINMKVEWLYLSFYVEI